jgi:hypothetical protein
MKAPGRRAFCAVLASAASVAATGSGARAENALAASLGEDGPTIAVAGPLGSEVAHWANLLHAALLHAPLSSGVPQAHTLRLSYLGGRDGVTGTNMFDARALPDGQAALLFPGGATLAWLVGDSRVRFDAAHLLPMLVAISSGVLCTRVGTASSSASLAGVTIRLGCDAMVAPGLTVLMALHMLGAKPQPVMASPDCLEAARRGEVDAVFARGLDMPGQLATLSRFGLKPAFFVGFPAHGLTAPANRALPDLAVLLASTRAENDPLLAAWRAVAAASLLEAVLALPRLCPASSLARWRAACDQALTTADLSGRLPENVRLLAGAESAAAFDAVMVDGLAQSALHRWMATQLNWRPT